MGPDAPKERAKAPRPPQALPCGLSHFFLSCRLLSKTAFVCVSGSAAGSSSKL